MSVSAQAGFRGVIAGAARSFASLGTTEGARRLHHLGRALGLLALVATAARAAEPSPGRAQGELTPGEERGKTFFTTGRSAAGGEVLALLESARLALPASSLTCAGCHGHDGRGRPEGGVLPSDITWPSLTKTYAAVRAGGREHPPYDERSLRLAITAGVDPAGNSLDATMPRYRLSVEDASDLIAYLKRLSDDRDPGLGDSEVVLGTLLPPGRERAESVRRTLEVAFDEVNRAGGLFGRKLRLAALAPTGPAGLSAAEVARFLDREQPFALVGPYLASEEREIAALLAERRLPAVGALGFDPELPDPDLGEPPLRQLFYLHTGLSGEALALIRHWHAHGGRGRVALVGHELSAPAVERARRWLAARSIETVTFEPTRWDAAAAAARLQSEGLQAVLLLRPGADVAAFLAAAGRLEFSPLVLVSATLAGAAAASPAPGFGGRLQLALPFLPGGPQSSGAAGRHAVARALATAAGRVLVEALRRNGRELSRERLIDSLEGLYRFETGVSLPLTYGPNLRSGTNGAYVLEVDLATGRLAARADWVGLE